MPVKTSFIAVLTVPLFFLLSTVSAKESAEGRWVSGDLHVHTALSADARTPLDEVMYRAFNDFHLDYMATSNHLRNNSRNNDGDTSIKQLFSSSLSEYEWAAIQRLAGAFPDKLLMSTFEWDMPTHDHMNIGILTDNDTKTKLAMTEYFEYRFGAKNTDADFSPDQLTGFKNWQVPRQNTTHEDSVAALKWLQDNYAGSGYAMLNHPTRYAGSYNMANIREFHDIAPDVFFLVEGMVGNQFNGYRGDYDNKSRAGLWGGSDPFTAEVGGNWDALLAEGRRIWLVTNSDHHFKAIPPYSSGYFPGEYSKTYVYLENEPLNQQNWLAAMRSGNSFSVYGDVINKLDFFLESREQQVVMGQTLNAGVGEIVTLSIRVSQPEHTNREKEVGNRVYDGTVPPLHHIDLIKGTMVNRIHTGVEGDESTKKSKANVIKTFTDKDWVIKEDGSYFMSLTFKAEEDAYYRLRGTTLKHNQTGFTVKGEPLRSKPIERGESFTPAYYETINQRNYTDTWFYSNPVFLEVREPLKVESFNLRYDNPQDGKNNWQYRKEAVKQHILNNKPDVLGMQEVLSNQFEWLKENLPGYEALGVGRDDGKTQGEYVPLFYNANVLALIDNGFFWLSETPDKPGSVGWEAHLPRITTWAKFRKGNAVFFAFNTHFSHVSDLARRKSAVFLRQQIQRIAGNSPVILTGDFNTADSSTAYQSLVAADSGQFFDAAVAAGQPLTGTFQDFGEVVDMPRIDYVFFSKHWQSDHFQTLLPVAGSPYLSDHNPVMVELALK